MLHSFSMHGDVWGYDVSILVPLQLSMTCNRYDANTTASVFYIVPVVPLGSYTGDKWPLLTQGSPWG